MQVVTEKSRYQDLVEEMFSMAGIKINGTRPFDIKVKNDNFYKRLIRDGTLGLGESYMDDWWECDSIDEMVTMIIRSKLHKKLIKNPRFIYYALKAKLTHPGKKTEVFDVAAKHYNLGNQLFKLMLDKRMVYSCAYWEDAKTLDEAQENKLDLICKKVGIKPGMRVLDIGCGWGGLARHAAEKYGAEVVGITVSKEQVDWGQKVCAGLPVDIRLQDYRDVNEKFDRILSIGMFENVCPPNYSAYMKAVDRCLDPQGLWILHTIGRSEPPTHGDHPWMDKYIWPNSEIPTMRQICKAVEKLFVVEDWHNFGADYDPTLTAWHKNFINHWPEIKNLYGERFFRMWKFYLLISVGFFRSRFFQLWHVVLSKGGLPEGFQKNIDYVFDGALSK